MSSPLSTTRTVLVVLLVSACTVGSGDITEPTVPKLTLIGPVGPIPINRSFWGAAYVEGRYYVLTEGPVNNELLQYDPSGALLAQRSVGFAYPQMGLHYVPALGRFAIRDMGPYPSDPPGATVRKGNLYAFDFDAGVVTSLTTHDVGIHQPTKALFYIERQWNAPAVSPDGLSYWMLVVHLDGGDGYTGQHVEQRRLVDDSLLAAFPTVDARASRFSFRRFPSVGVSEHSVYILSADSVNIYDPRSGDLVATEHVPGLPFSPGESCNARFGVPPSGDRIIYPNSACTQLLVAPLEYSPQPDTVVSELAAAGDTYLRQGAPNQNLGDDVALRLQSSGHNRAVVAFSSQQIDSVAAGGSVVSAKLMLTIVDNGNNWGTVGRLIDIHRLTTSWTEMGATWHCAIDSDPSNSYPDCENSDLWAMDGPDARPWDSVPTSSVVMANGLAGIVEVDVTADVVAFVNGVTPHHGWIVKKQAEGSAGRIEFSSREGPAAPRLTITVSSP